MSKNGRRIISVEIHDDFFERLSLIDHATED
jgi:hypothetical protein